jgi:hypothetical protein
METRLVNEKVRNERALREAVLKRLYLAFLEEGLYRGVVSKKDLSSEFKAEGVVLERNLEYLLEKGLIRMHKIEDLISITPEGIDLMETGEARGLSEVAASLARIEKLLRSILEAMKKGNRP